MAKSTTPTSPSTSRKWLHFGLGLLLCLIGVLFLFRYLSGNTTKETRAIASAEKAAKELAAKSAGNPEGFSAKLESKRKEREEQDVRDRQALALTSPGATGLPGSAVPGSASALRTEGFGAPGSQGMGGRIVGGGQSGGMPSGAPKESDADLDRYASMKEALAEDKTRKLGIWEPGLGNVVGAAAGGNGLLSQLTAQQNAALAQGGARDGAGTSSVDASRNAMMEAYSKSLSQPNAPALANDVKFMQTTGQEADKKSELAPLMVRGGLGQFALMEGTMIPVTMRTDVSSDLQGPCLAEVTQDVYDTATQQRRLVSTGTRIVCAYDSAVVMGQERLLLAFTRMIFPKTNASVRLSSMPAADVEGAIGAPADVNNRFWKIFGSSFLIAWVSNKAMGGANVSVTTGTNGTTTSGPVAGQVLADVTSKILQRNINIKPELRLKAGDRLSLVVTRDMVLDPSVTGVR